MCAECCIAQCIVLIGSALFTLTIPPLPSLCPRSPSHCPVHSHCAPFTNMAPSPSLLSSSPSLCPPHPLDHPLLSSLCFLHLTLPPSHSLCLLHPLCAPSAVVLRTQSCVVLLRAVRVALDGVRVVLAEGCVLCAERGSAECGVLWAEWCGAY